MTYLFTSSFPRKQIIAIYKAMGNKTRLKNKIKEEIEVKGGKVGKEKSISLEDQLT